MEVAGTASIAVSAAATARRQAASAPSPAITAVITFLREPSDSMQAANSRQGTCGPSCVSRCVRVWQWADE